MDPEEPERFRNRVVCHLKYAERKEVRVVASDPNLSSHPSSKPTPTFDHVRAEESHQKKKKNHLSFVQVWKVSGREEQQQQQNNRGRKADINDYKNDTD